MVAHSVPFQCRITPPPPPSPTAQTSFAALPQTPLICSFVLLATFDQSLPFQCKRVPDEPTAQTSFPELPQTALRSSFVLLSTCDQSLPFQRRIVADEPTAQTSLDELPQTPLSWLVVSPGKLDQEYAVKFWSVTFAPLRYDVRLAGKNMYPL